MNAIALLLVSFALGAAGMWLYFLVTGLIRTPEEYYLAHQDDAAAINWPGESVHWNPGNKVVQDHRNGEIYPHLTNMARARRSLPVPWHPTMSEAETRLPDIP